jgi:hypothetical protein
MEALAIPMLPLPSSLPSDMELLPPAPGVQWIGLRETLPSGYVKIAFEHGQKNTGFSH